MKRHELIFALRKHAHPQWYHELLRLSTPALRALLAYYEADESEKYKGTYKHDGVTLVVRHRKPDTGLKLIYII